MTEYNLEAHISVCEERYKTITAKLDTFNTQFGTHRAEVNARLDRLNGRWWTVIVWLVGALSLGCVSLTVYIYLNQIMP